MPAEEEPAAAGYPADRLPPGNVKADANVTVAINNLGPALRPLASPRAYPRSLCGHASRGRRPPGSHHFELPDVLMSPAFVLLDSAGTYDKHTHIKRNKLIYSRSIHFYNHLNLR